MDDLSVAIQATYSVLESTAQRPMTTSNASASDRKPVAGANKINVRHHCLPFSSHIPRIVTQHYRICFLLTGQLKV